jgi:hypothetical protein
MLLYFFSSNLGRQPVSMWGRRWPYRAVDDSPISNLNGCSLDGRTLRNPVVLGQIWVWYEKTFGLMPGAAQPKRFHGTPTLDPTRVGRDAGRIAEEVIAHLSGLVGAKVMVTLEVEAEVPNGAPDHVVRTVTENARTLKFTSQGFEKE